MAKKDTARNQLTGSRIYQRRQRYYLFWATPIINPETGKVAKWHSLCAVSEGKLKALTLADKIIRHNAQDPNEGNMPLRLKNHLGTIISMREKEVRPSDPDKLKMYLERNKDLGHINRVLEEAFFEFDVEDVLPVHVAAFLDSKADTPRMAQVYRSHLLKFFKWACRKGWRETNPIENVSVPVPKTRKVYITDEKFLEMREALLVGADGKPLKTGRMTRAFVDLCYLSYQRSTELRLLKKHDVHADRIHFKPTKTENTSGADIIIPITSDIRAALNEAAAAAAEHGIESEYVFPKLDGTPYQANGIRSAWRRAFDRVGLSGMTLKDLRPKGITDAVRLGYDLKDVSISAAHTDIKTTQGYIKKKETPVSNSPLNIPKSKKE